MSDTKRKMAAVGIAVLAVVLIVVSAGALIGQSSGFDGLFASEKSQTQEQTTEQASDQASVSSEDAQAGDSQSSSSSLEPGGTTASSESSGKNASAQSNSSQGSGNISAKSSASTDSSVWVSVQVVADSVDQPFSTSRTVTLAQGSSVYDALVSTGISVSASSSSYGMYVRSIQGLSEKQYGSNSGWMYSVNGVTPMTACSNYLLKNGDSVVWYYVI